MTSFKWPPEAASGGLGDVVGPASATDEAIARYDGTTGKLIQNSGVTIDNSNVVSGITQLNVDNIRVDGNTISSTDTNGNIVLDPNGTGVVAVDNLSLTGNTIASTDVNGNIVLDPNGTGAVVTDIIQTSGSSGVIIKNSSGTQVADFGPANTTNSSFSGNVQLNANSLLLTGSVAASGSRSTKGWFTDLDVTNTITGSISGNAATVTTNANLTGDVTSVGNATSIAAGVIVNNDVNASAAIAVSKLAALTVSRAVVTDGSGFISASNVTSTEIGYLNGVTSLIQTQLDAKQARSTLTTKGDIYVATSSGVVVRQGVGSDGFVLTVDGSQTNGIKYASPVNSSDAIFNLSIAATVAASALTIAIKTAAGNDASSTDPIFIGFGNSTISSGPFSTRTLAAALSLVITSGSTLGQLSGVESEIYVYLINDSGTLRLGVCRIKLPEDQLWTTVAEGGAGGADLPYELYSSGVYSNVRIRCVGKLINTQATAGTWATNPSSIILAPLPEQFVGCRYNSNAGTTYNNTTVTTVVNEDRVQDPLNLYGLTVADEFYAPLTGWYTCSIVMQLAATTAFSGTEVAAVFFQINAGNVAVVDYYPDATNIAKPFQLTFNGYAERGQLIRFRFQQDSGSNLPVTTTASRNTVSFVYTGERN